MSKNKILIVDDAPDTIWPLIQELEAEYEVYFATSGAKGLEAAAAQAPNLILLDILMPEMDGYEVLARLKADSRTKDIPVIFLTSKTAGEDEAEAKGLTLGAQDYIAKPVRLPVARVRIRSILNLHQEMERRLTLKRQFEELNRQLKGEVKCLSEEIERSKKTIHAYETRYSRMFQESREKSERQDRLLVVDDNPENIHLLIENLEDKYEVLFATNGEKALRIAMSDAKPDLVLLDVMMPVMDGYEICARLKANPTTSDIPVIFITAMSEVLDETKGLELGAVDYIVKPFSMPVVRARVDVALRLKREMDTRMELTFRLKKLNQELEERVLEKTEDLRKAHDDLIVSEKKYRDIYENAMEGIFQSTHEGRFLSANPSLASILGYASPEELLQSVTDISSQVYARGQDFEAVRRDLNSLGEVKGLEVQLRKKDGELLWCFLSARAVHGQNGESGWFQGFLVDVTELKRMRELMVQNEKMMSLGGLAGGMAHEIKNCLTTVVGNAQVVLNRLVSNQAKNQEAAKDVGLELDVLHQYVQKRSLDSFLLDIKEMGARASTITNNMLDYSRRTDAPTGLHDLNRIVEKALEFAAKDYEISSRFAFWAVDVVKDLAEPSPTLRCAPSEIEQVLFNLIKNAAQAMSEKGGQAQDTPPRLTIRTYAQDDHVVLEVQDNGPGMDEKTRARIFDPFFTTKPEGVGTGLGLSVARFIVVTKYDGELEVVSQPGCGATFIIRLPRS